MITPRITVVGSLNMDIVVSMKRMPKIGETIHGEEVHYIPGGKGANQALGCARLTADTRMIGCVGQDMFGETLLQQMKDNGIGLDGLEAVQGRMTGTAHISHTPDNNCIVVVPGANESCTAAYVRERKVAIQTANIVMAQLEVPLEAVMEAFTLAKSGGALTILNPAPARPLPEGLLQLTDYMTPNETEWELISGTDDQDENRLASSIAEFQNRYGCNVIVTRGEKGASYTVDGKLATFRAPAVKPVDTTGAGDSFNAALAFALAQGKPMHDAVSFAVTAASLSVQKFGAQDGMPTLEEVLGTQSSD
ncbi:ribokinase [Paenibacillus spongiae]|uniref:Ribokinase n=1 Tax=Paenibacillus spongiae TaxID=2909671 RepID=A0ABY5SDJ9_9BACL|nr:ribokinase [Paenibacillus spongiae]UVI31834.1 ribokinase [Paenibacillus spongiae]